MDHRLNGGANFQFVLAHQHKLDKADKESFVLLASCVQKDFFSQ